MVTMEKSTMTTKEEVKHNCDYSEFVSLCCGAGSHEYVETICARCHDYAGFECIDCGKLEDEYRGGN